MPLDDALDKAKADLSQMAPYVVAARSGAQFRDGKFHLPFFNRLFLIGHPVVTVVEAGSQVKPSPWIQVLLLHYLVCASGVEVADQWVVYRNLPGGFLFDSRFREMAMAPLTRAFSNDIESFRRAGLALGGIPMSRLGDAAFRFLAYPRLPMACILYLGDEEVAGAVNILFDAAAPDYLPTEDLSYLGRYLSDALCRHRAQR